MAGLHLDRVLFRFGAVALHLAWVFFNVYQGIVYFWIGWPTFGEGLVYFWFGCITFSLGLFSKRGLGKKDSFGIKIQQPLRIERGGMSLSIPYARTRSREVLFRNEFVDLSPRGREIELQLIHQTAFHG